MNLMINETPRSFEKASTLMEVLEELGLAQSDGVAAAINLKVVPKTEWQTSTINDGDNISILKPAQGG